MRTPIIMIKLLCTGEQDFQNGQPVNARRVLLLAFPTRQSHALRRARAPSEDEHRRNS